ncbi:aldo/keto reductase [Mycobacterium yunnanensis]|uniref:Aldo/keto reductase n=1 Tax=Mycobacterium yunnanensis TaxID=368477 RepID=A0A9X2Z4G5_9MYCO|nr:aldo/keto reductase [Mycobacterium yunnanensis]MCV7421697.1 aldo/keto reductase [Mycobacterium yunnanensis]
MKTSDVRTHRRTGLQFSAIGYGGAPIGNFNGTVTDDEARRHVDQSWGHGVRYFDTAPGYGNGLSEYRLGHALRRRDRTDFLLSTKVGRTVTPRRGAATSNGQYVELPSMAVDFDYSYDGVMRAVEQSMQRMLVDHLDALFVHDCDRYTHGSSQPEYFRQAVVSGFPALESLRDQGVVTAIGFGVNETDVMIDAVKAVDVDLCLLAGRYTLLEQEPLDTLFPLCEERGVGIVLGGAYNSGILAKGPVRDARFDYAAAPTNVMSKVVALQDVCASFDVELPAVALQFAYAHPVVTSVCVGSRNEQQQQRNAELAATDVPQDLWQALRDANLLRDDAPTPV